MSHKLPNIENLLETMGSHERIGEPEHRYELRRSLLSSRFFAVESARISRWDRMLTYTAPLVAGGMMVGVFTLMAVYAPAEPEVGPQTIVSRSMTTQADETSLVEASPLNAEDFLSDPSEPIVKLADFETSSSRSVVRYTPLSSQEYVRTQ